MHLWGFAPLVGTAVHLPQLSAPVLKRVLVVGHPGEQRLFSWRVKLYPVNWLVAAKDNLNVRIWFIPKPFRCLNASFLAVVIPVGGQLEHIRFSLELLLLFSVVC